MDDDEVLFISSPAGCEVEGEPMKPSQERMFQIEQELQQLEQQLAELVARQGLLLSEKARLREQIEESMRPKLDWCSSFEWDPHVMKLLKDVFHLTSFRPMQQQVINASLYGQDVMGLLPAGMGKSLCYQLPALISESGVTLVVSPLLSLIQDQILSLSAVGVCAAALTSHTPKEEANATLARLGAGGADPIRLLYLIVASKRIMAKLEKLYQAGKLARIVIDEAHCCSAWGNDFRPDYKKLGILKQQFPQAPVMALTATATSQVADDIKSILRIPRCETFRHSINRPNIFYDVQQREATSIPQTAQDILAWVGNHFEGKPTGIVYCLTRKDCEQLTQELNMAGVLSARCYHADMDISDRELAHREWSQGKVQVMVATIAFGMGVSCTAVRFVVHASLSKSIENYYQESGRAGRDAGPARCLLIYRFSDVMRQAAIVCMDPNWKGNLMGICRFAASSGKCRRAMIQRHFGESPAACNGSCDVCEAHAQARVEEVDVTAHVLAVLRALQGMSNAEKRATVIQLVDAWRKAKQMDAEAAKEARTMSRSQCEEILADMVLKDLLELDFGFTSYTTNTYLKASVKGMSLLRRPETAQPVLLERRPCQGQAQGDGACTQQAGSGSVAAKPPKQQRQGKGEEQTRRQTAGAAAAEPGASRHVLVIESSDEEKSEEFMAPPPSKRGRRANNDR